MVWSKPSDVSRETSVTTDDVSRETSGTVWLLVGEIATRLRVSKMSVYRLIDRGELPAHRFGKALRVDEAELTAYLASTTTGGG